jgi:hypothetical protein
MLRYKQWVVPLVLYLFRAAHQVDESTAHVLTDDLPRGFVVSPFQALPPADVFALAEVVDRSSASDQIPAGRNRLRSASSGHRRRSRKAVIRSSGWPGQRNIKANRAGGAEARLRLAGSGGRGIGRTFGTSS